MSPTTVLEIFLFLVLVAPGLCYELLRERRRPALEETAFREASRVALVSVVLDSVVLAIFALVQAIAPRVIPNPSRWIADPHGYVSAHTTLVGASIAAFTVVSIGLAALVDHVFHGRRSSGHIEAGGIWFQLFRSECPAGCVPWVSLHLSDGTDIGGFLFYYVFEVEPTRREIALKHNVEGSGMRLRSPGSSQATRLDKWDSVVIRGDVIDYFKVSYLPAISG